LVKPCRDQRLQGFLLRVSVFRCCVNNPYLAFATETFLYALPRIDVNLYAMHCLYSCIRCCGDVFQQFAVQQSCIPCFHGNVLSEAPPSIWADCSFQASCHNFSLQTLSHVTCNLQSHSLYRLSSI
jgi:hypothetical protein